MQEFIHEHFEKDRRYHEMIAQQYDSVVVSPRKVTNDILFEQFSRFVKPGQKMLDIACGTGHMIMRYAKNFSEVTAVDHSRAMLAQAQRKIVKENLQHINLIEQDVFAYLRNEKKGYFDFVSCVGFLHHLPSEQIPDVVANIFGLIRKSGVLLLSEPVRIQENLIPKMIREWNRSSLAMGTHYSIDVEEPDEEPLEPMFFVECVNKVGLLLKVQRSFEIFPHHSPANYWDILAIKLMNKIYGRVGNVMTIASRKI